MNYKTTTLLIAKILAATFSLAASNQTFSLPESPHNKELIKKADRTARIASKEAKAAREAENKKERSIKIATINALAEENKKIAQQAIDHAATVMDITIKDAIKDVEATAAHASVLAKEAIAAISAESANATRNIVCSVNDQLATLEDEVAVTVKGVPQLLYKVV